MWTPLEMRTFDLFHPLYLDMKFYGYTISLGATVHGQATYRGGYLWLGHLHGWPPITKPPTGVVAHGQAPCKSDCPRPGRLQGRLHMARAACKGGRS
ncbi:hypothetical protein BHM03_00007405 [Ensete ventricosum]|nr:hypothetical protein BHM03_00007405 [Ensete ventricosum]